MRKQEGMKKPLRKIRPRKSERSRFVLQVFLASPAVFLLYFEVIDLLYNISPCFDPLKPQNSIFYDETPCPAFQANP